MIRLSFTSIATAIVLALSCSLDAFAAAFAYGSNRIRIPMFSNQIINLICSSILGISLWIGVFVRQYLPAWLAIGISFTILLILGAVKLLDSVTKAIIRKHSNISRELKFSVFNFKFILQLYADPEAADVDASRVISPKEAAVLAISLSLDGMAIGFGAALGDINVLAAILASLITNMAAVTFGSIVGNKIARKLNFNLSWLSGAILIILAIIKLI